MKTLLAKSLLVLCLASTAGVLTADDRFTGRYRLPAIDSIEWRLGASNGALGFQIMYRAPGTRGWHQAPGRATALGNGWVLGTDRHTGGFGIYRWNGYNWSRMPGAAVRIGGSYQQPWVINDRNIRYVWNGYTWRQDRNDGARNNSNGRFDRDWQRSFDRRDYGQNYRRNRDYDRNRNDNGRDDRDDRNFRQKRR